MPPDPERHERQLEAVLDIAWAISSPMRMDALLPLIMKHVTAVMDADRSTFFVVDAARGELWSKVLQGEAVVEIRLPVGEGLAGWVAAHGEIINLRDAYTDPRFDRSWDQATGYRTRSLLCVPIPDRDGNVIAVIQCLNKRGRSFHAEDEALLSAIGRQCAVAIERAMLHDEVLQQNLALQRAEAELRAAHGELEVLYAVERLIAQADDELGLVRSVLRGVCEHLSAVGVVIALRTERGGELYSVTPGAEAGHLGLDAGQMQALSAAASGHAQASASAAASAALAACGVDVPPGLVCGAPIGGGHGCLGTLYVLGLGPEIASDASAQRTVHQVATQVARGLSLIRERDASQRAERLSLLGHSAAAILHDLRTPMTAVGGYVELMTMEPDAAAREAHAQRVERALAHMDSMTQEVMAFARGSSELLRQKVYMNVFVDEVREMLVPETERFGVTLEVDATFDGVARFDAGKLKRVLFNLARNACQAMGEGGHFTWRVAERDGKLVLECSDDGPGIPEEIRGRLFESFATHGKQDGTGLGLAMAKRIVEAHEGAIECNSVAGQGATFVITLPL